MQRVLGGQSLATDLGAEFDLSYRPNVGDVHYYRMEASYRMLTDRGLTSQRESYVGDHRRVVDKVEGGVPTETITWRKVMKRWADGEQDFEIFERIEWAEGFTYTFSPNRPVTHDIGAKAKDFPRDLLGWNVYLLMIDTHGEFDYPRTEQGGIRKLRRIGDSIRQPIMESGTGDIAIDFRPFIEVSPWEPKDNYTRFVGLTIYDGEPCAILECEQPDRAAFRMVMQGTQMESSSNLLRTVVFRLSDGALEHGRNVEWVCANGMWINPVYTIERMTQEDFERSTNE